MKNIFHEGRNVARYSVVGCTATAVEWVMFFILNVVCHVQYRIAVVISMMVSTFSNWAVGRLVMFPGTGSPAKEIGKIFLTGFMGMSFNLLLMWIMVDKLAWPAMASKIIATLVVFVWNYTITTRVVYKGKIKRHFGRKPENEKQQP